MLIRHYALAAAGCCALTFNWLFDAAGQEAPAAAPAAGPARVVRGPDGKTMMVPPGGPPMPTGDAKPPGDATKPEDGKKPGENKDDPNAKKPEESKAVTRPTEPPEKPNPEELTAKPDDGGLLRFNFRYQPWAEVLEWLARVSDMSLDWQELPGGFLNLSTQRAYTVEETRDLINRHLLARGYTMLQNGEVLSIVKISDINPGLVPRVAADKLQDLLPHEFAKVSFELEWLLADEAVEELKPMKSPNGTLTALKNTNRIEAMDAVINLREIYHLLLQEQSDTGQDNLIQEFVLLHARATDVLASLEELLGLESKKAAAAPMNPQQMQQMQQMMQQQMQQQGGQPPGQAPKKPSEIHLIVNARKNSVVAHAAPDKMAIIERAVVALDVENSHRDGLLNKPFQIHAYRLHSLSPAPLVKTLQDVGDLDPNTRLEADETSKSIVAYASLVDHTTIQQLIDNLDGSGREFEVIPLRRLAADYVAGTIEFMMIGEQKEEEPQSRYFGYYGGSSQSEEAKDDDQFRVDADVENNILLLWANAVEIEAVRALLVKLGEIPPEGGRTSKMRVLNVLPPEEAAKFLERLRQAWPSLAPNDLNLPTLPEADEKAAPESETKPNEPEAKEVRSSSDNLTLVVFDASEQEGEKPAEADDPKAEPAQPPENETAPPSREELRRLLMEGQREKSAAPAPVSVSIDPSGRLVITSQDTNALDLLEELVGQLAPPAPDYEIFKLLHVDAFYVKDNLEDFFKEEDDEQKNSNRRYYYYDYQPQNEEKARSRLSQRPKLKFIYDYDSNTILVQGATADQLATITELIAIYDKPESDDSQSARLSAVYQIKYSKATVIAEAIKDVYRDLLSSNDKSLQQQGNPEAKNRQPGGMTYIFNEGEEGDKPDRTHLSFKGKLSIGIDEVSNVLLISAEGEQLMKSVDLMIETLDKAAQPVTTVSVVKLGGNMNAAKVREVLAGLLGDQQSAAQPAGVNPPQANPQANPQNGNQSRGNNSQGEAAAPVAQ